MTRPNGGSFLWVSSRRHGGEVNPMTNPDQVAAQREEAEKREEEERKNQEKQAKEAQKGQK